MIQTSSLLFKPKSLAVDIVGMAGRVAKITTWSAFNDVDGMLYQDSTGQFVIVVNDKRMLVKQRYTIAHEYSHYLLHVPHMKGPIYCSAYGRINNKIEREADKLAAEILMPEELVRAVTSKCFYNSIILARTFDVSIQAMEIRLERLKIPDRRIRKADFDNVQEYIRTL